MTLILILSLAAYVASMAAVCVWMGSLPNALWKLLIYPPLAAMVLAYTGILWLIHQRRLP